MSHNFVHSFVSYENYIDNEYVVEDLKKFARRAEGERIRIQWIPFPKYRWPKFNKRVRKSIKLWQKWLPEHMSNHRVSREMISEMYMEIYRKPSHQLCVEAILIDSRGKKYSSEVAF